MFVYYLFCIGRFYIVQVKILDVVNVRVDLSPGSIGNDRNILGIPHFYTREKSAPTVLWPWLEGLNLRVIFCRFSSNCDLWCSAPFLSTGLIIIPLTIFMIFDCDMFGGCGGDETLSYGSILNLALFTRTFWLLWRCPRRCHHMIGTSPPNPLSHNFSSTIDQYWREVAIHQTCELVM